MTIGNTGAGTLIIDAGGVVNNMSVWLPNGSVSSGIGIVGSTSTGIGAVTILGAGSAWNNTDNLYVGYGPGASGSLIIADGGLATANNMTLGIMTPTSGGTGTIGGGAEPRR